jgi:hypothetical protein
MRLAFVFSAAVLIPSPAWTENVPERDQQDWQTILEDDCITGEVHACLEIGYLRYLNWHAVRTVQPALLEGTPDQECNRGVMNGLVRQVGQQVEQQGGSSVDGAEPWPPPPLQVSSCD